jgi:sialate O-acetylesterase
VAKGGEALEGFYVAGADHKFHKAEAVIEGNTVIVRSAEVAFPVAVRYAWADNPVCNLYNGAELPASPFRTDCW